MKNTSVLYTKGSCTQPELARAAVSSSGAKVPEDCERSGAWGTNSILTVRRNLKLAYQKQLPFAHKTATGKTFQWEQKPLKRNRN